MVDTVTRDNWREAVRERHFTAPALALATGSSVRAIYSYLQGARRPDDAFIARVASVVAAFDMARQEIA